jgi:hypothetical protein
MSDTGRRFSIHKTAGHISRLGVYLYTHSTHTVDVYTNKHTEYRGNEEEKCIENDG